MVGWMARIRFLGFLARDLSERPNSAENFARYEIFLGLNNEISRFPAKFRPKNFPWTQTK
jgi:hypothetical protein